jgi:hypothetical protein
LNKQHRNSKQIKQGINEKTFFFFFFSVFRFPALKSIHLSNCVPQNVPFTIEYLWLDSIILTSGQIAQKLGHLRNLHNLRLWHCSFKDFQSAVEIFQHFVFLEKLDLRFCALSDSFLESLAYEIRTSMKKSNKTIYLRKIDISDCTNITANGVSCLTNLGHILVEHSFNAVPRAFRLRDN